MLFLPLFTLNLLLAVFAAESSITFDATPLTIRGNLLLDKRQECPSGTGAHLHFTRMRLDRGG
jgi:hypothetical protein